MILYVSKGLALGIHSIPLCFSLFPSSFALFHRHGSFCSERFASSFARALAFTGRDRFSAAALSFAVAQPGDLFRSFEFVPPVIFPV